MMFTPPECRIVELPPKAQVLMRALILEMFKKFKSETGLSDDKIIDAVQDLMFAGYLRFRIFDNERISLEIAPELERDLPMFDAR